MAEPFDIRKEEYVALQAEIEHDLKELSELERNCVLASALAYSWVTATTIAQPQIAFIAWFVPVLLPLYGSARTYAVILQLALKGTYLKAIEEKELPVGDGWQHYFFAVKGFSFTNVVRRAFWALFLVLSLAASVTGYLASIGKASPASQPGVPSAAVGASQVK